jgi:hypothetical protein
MDISSDDANIYLNYKVLTKQEHYDAEYMTTEFKDRYA